MYKNTFTQILSIESGSQEELEKCIRIMDITENIEEDKYILETVQTNLDLHIQIIRLERRSLMRDSAKYRQLPKMLIGDINDRQLLMHYPT